jgi:hypothetical protein
MTTQISVHTTTAIHPSGMVAMTDPSLSRQPFHEAIVRAATTEAIGHLVTSAMRP